MSIQFACNYIDFKVNDSGNVSNRNMNIRLSIADNRWNKLNTSLHINTNTDNTSTFYIIN